MKDLVDKKIKKKIKEKKETVKKKTKKKQKTGTGKSAQLKSFKGAGKSALLKSSFKSMRKTPYTVKQVICPICQQELNNGRKITEVECCKNKFHTICICKWLNNYKNNKCPLCKTKIEKKEEIEKDPCYNYMKYSYKYRHIKDLENFKEKIIEDILKIIEKYGTDRYYLDTDPNSLIIKYKNRQKIIEDSERYIDLNRIKLELDNIV